MVWLLSGNRDIGLSIKTSYRTHIMAHIVAQIYRKLNDSFITRVYELQNKKKLFSHGVECRGIIMYL